MPPFADAVLAIIKTILDIHLETLRALPATERAAYATRVMEDLRFWRDLFRPPTP